MHRSGTSLCSHVLSMLGVDMTDKIPGPGSTSLLPDNPRGHWERWEIVEFHDRILGFFKRGYFTPFHDFPLPVAWWADPRVAGVKREMIDFLDGRMGKACFGFKDPRTARLMPVWHQIVKELNLAPRIVFCLRNPAQVARSLHARDGLDLDIGEHRWFTYMVDFFRYTNRFAICTVEYERWFDEPSVNLTKLQNFLNLDWPHSDPDLDLAISDIVDYRLRHDASYHREASQPLVRSLYKLAKCADRDTAAREQAQLIASQFVSFQQLQKPFQQVFECTSDLAAKLPEVEEKAAALRAALAERDTTMEAAIERLAAADAKTETLQTRVAALEGERDDLDLILQSARAELAQRGDALSRVEAALSEQIARIAALQSQIETSRGVLAEAELHEVEASAVADALSAEIALARIALSRSEQAHADTCVAMQAENEGLRSALDNAEQRRQQSQDANAAVQGEITSLRSDLAAARDVGTAAFAALRDQLATAPRELQGVRRPPFVLQRFGFRTTDLLPRIPASPASMRHRPPSLPGPPPLCGERTGLRGLFAPRPLISPTRRAFVVGAYLPSGGAYMAYHLGRILHLDLGLEIVSVAVGDESVDNGIFHYDVRFPGIGVADMEHQIADSDILIANPSFSNYFFGPRLPGRKLMYIQGFNTFALLDRYFDLYASVSRFVARFVKMAYGVSAPVIPGFVERDRLPPVIVWQDRPAASIVVYLKGDATFKEVMLSRLRDAVARRVPGVDLDNVLDGPPLSHTDFLARIGACRYLVSLSAAEGFGLVPLEAMAMGTTVIGFDGFGGREYMRSGKNCLVTRYPDIEGVAEQLAAALNAPAFAERLAERGRVTTSHFTYARFRAAWHHQLRHFLTADGVACPT
jgi:glycosyltransferase involved in cell wall biosynthesis